MALEGSIRDFSLADIFQLIGIQRKTGILTLRSGEEEVKVSFLNGMVVNADSKTKRLDDRLGTVLSKTGKLSSEDLKKALKLQRETLKKVGHILVEESFVRPEDLREALSIQITQIIYRLFRWKDGDYHFEQDIPVDYDKENFTPMSAESILMEGMRMIDEWPLIEKKIPSFDMIFERVPLGGAAPTVDQGQGEESVFDDGRKDGGDEAAPHIRLSREENLVYEQVDGKITVQEIIDRTMLSEFETCRALFDLMNRNLLSPLKAPTRSTAAARPAPAAIGHGAARLLYLVLPVAVVLVFPLQRLNPLNYLRLPRPAGPAVDALRQQLAETRVERLAEAVDAFRLTRQALPGSAQELVEAGLVRPEDLLDPWGRPIQFEASGDRVVISAATGEGAGAAVVRRERTPGG